MEKNVRRRTLNAMHASTMHNSETISFSYILNKIFQFLMLSTKVIVSLIFTELSITMTHVAHFNIIVAKMPE